MATSPPNSASKNSEFGLKAMKADPSKSTNSWWNWKPSKKELEIGLKDLRDLEKKLDRH